MPEALEKWTVELFGRVLPRHLEIVYGINQRFMNEIRTRYPNDEGKTWRMSLIEEGHTKRVRMAHLAVVGSHSINGVAALHTELLKRDLFSDFHELWPERFNSKTNGVTLRRWLLASNPKLASLITECIDGNWAYDATDLRRLEPLADDSGFRKRFAEIKRENKDKLAQIIEREHGIEIDRNSIFDVQVKRIHEYKRQLLNLLHVVTLYRRLKQGRASDAVPRTVIFAGKAAPGYAVAKHIIKLVNSVADVVNHDPDVHDKLKVVFMRNYRVSLAERIFPASELSEQISTAGTEASGTGNMKFALNGALTIGTLDGANVEIRNEVEPDNFFLFGLTVEEVRKLRDEGYNPYEYYEKNEELRGVIDSIRDGEFSPNEPELFRSLMDSLLYGDVYMLLADYAGYVACQERVADLYRDHDAWNRMAILNVARSGVFSSDRTIQQYADEIWKVSPVKPA